MKKRFNGATSFRKLIEEKRKGNRINFDSFNGATSFRKLIGYKFLNNFQQWFTFQWGNFLSEIDRLVSTGRRFPGNAKFQWGNFLSEIDRRNDGTE